MAKQRNSGNRWEGKCKKMQFDPYYKGELMNLFKELKTLIPKTASSSIDYEVYFRYLALCFDPNSPLVAEVEELKRRRDIARKEIGFIGEGDLLVEWNFLKFTRSRLWQLIFVNECLFDSTAEQLLQPLDGSTEEEKLKCAEKQAKLRKEMSLIYAEITSLRRQMFSGDDELEAVATKSMPVNAESMSNYLKSGRDED